MFDNRNLYIRIADNYIKESWLINLYTGGFSVLEQKFHGIWQTSFFRLIQEGIIQSEDIEVVAKTIIYSLQGMIMLSFSSNGSTRQEDIKEELVKLINYLFKKNKENI